MDEDEAAAGRALRKIAALLGIPIADFFAPPADTGAQSDEAAALAWTFGTVRDPRTRRAPIEIPEATVMEGQPDDPEPEER